MNIVMTFSDDPLTLTQRLFSEIHRASHRVTNLIVNYGVLNGKGNYLDLAADGQVSWRPAGRVAADGDPYDVKGRMKGRPAKAIRSFIHKEHVDDISAKDWEDFTNKFLVGMKNANTLQLVRGEDIVTYYDEASYSKNRYVRTLASSCMRYSSLNEPIRQLYAANPEQCEMLVEFDETGGVIARAIVWTTDQRGSGKMMDRIYGDDVSVEKFRQHAREQGWTYKQRNSYNSPTMVVLPSGEACTRQRSVTLTNAPTDKYPYCDTFHYYVPEQKKLINALGLVKGDDTLIYQLTSTSGGYHHFRGVENAREIN